jgi:diaminopimelate decarboxylase
MDHFRYHEGELYAENVAISQIVKNYGTPCYVYSRATLERHWHVFDRAFGHHPHLICYAVKANSNLAVLNVLARLDSGFDIVSVGELERVLCAGGKPDHIVFSGVGKRENELRRALEVDIRCFNVESRSELEVLNRVALSTGTRAPISLRVNPDIDARTHPYIATGLKQNKFGVDIETAITLYQHAALLSGIRIEGIDCHIGSQLTELTPFVEALTRLIDLAEQLRRNGIPIKHLDLGGGLGIRYRDEQPPLPDEYAKHILAAVQDNPWEILLEPGRAIIGNAGILVTRIEYLKHSQVRNFAIVDAAMNDLMRPALYQAWQEITPVAPRPKSARNRYDIVGPVCESADFLGKNRELNVEAGDLLAVRSAGAYGFSMASNYNTRPRPAEIMVDGCKAHLVRARETIEQLVLGEQMLPE